MLNYFITEVSIISVFTIIDILFILVYRDQKRTFLDEKSSESVE